jgi:hypothetical protein
VQKLGKKDCGILVIVNEFVSIKKQSQDTFRRQNVEGKRKQRRPRSLASTWLCQSSFHQILHHHNQPGQATIGQSVAAVPSGPSWTPPPLSELKRNNFLEHLNLVHNLTGYFFNILNCYLHIRYCYILQIIALFLNSKD